MEKPGLGNIVWHDAGRAYGPRRTEASAEKDADGTLFYLFPYYSPFNLFTSTQLGNSEMIHVSSKGDCLLGLVIFVGPFKLGVFCHSVTVLCLTLLKRNRNGTRSHRGGPF